MKRKTSFVISKSRGKRSLMQDSHVCKKMLNQPESTYFAVYDGHGGSASSGLAAKKLHKLVDTYLNSNVEPLEALRRAFIDLDQEIQQLDYKDGTTASVVIVKDNYLYVAHVGDSRIVLKRDSEIIQVTKDHKLTDPEELAKYRSSNWFLEKSRLVSQGKIKGFKLIAVSRSLGDNFFEDAISPIPDTSEIKLTGNEKIVIASDGLWNVSSNEEVFKIVEQYAPQQAADFLIQDALNKGSTDNITVVIIFFKK